MSEHDQGSDCSYNGSVGVSRYFLACSTITCLFITIFVFVCGDLQTIIPKSRSAGEASVPMHSDLATWFDAPKQGRLMASAGWVSRLDHGSFKNGFPTYKEANALLEEWLQKFPTLFRKKQIGHSFENRPIHAYILTAQSNAELKKPQIMITSLMHAREPASLTVVLYFIGHILELYEQGVPEAVYLILFRECWIVPFVNLDGYLLIERSPAMQVRKNRRPTCRKSVDSGVDINRNFPVAWKKDRFAKCNEEYQGTEPFSEPETQALKKICDENNFKAALNFHTFGSMLTHPYNYAPTVRKSRLPKEDDNLIYREIQGAFKFDKFGPAISTVGYTAPGESDDWFYDAKGIIAMSPEVGPESGDFFPPRREIAGIDSRNFVRTMYLVKKVGLEFGISLKQQHQTDKHLRGSPQILHKLEMNLLNSGLSTSSGKLMTVTVEIRNTGWYQGRVEASTKAGATLPVDVFVVQGALFLTFQVPALERRSKTVVYLSFPDGWKVANAQEVLTCAYETGNFCHCLGPSKLSGSDNKVAVLTKARQVMLGKGASNSNRAAVGSLEDRERHSCATALAASEGPGIGSGAKPSPDETTSHATPASKKESSLATTSASTSTSSTAPTTTSHHVRTEPLEDTRSPSHGDSMRPKVDLNAETSSPSDNASIPADGSVEKPRKVYREDTETSSASSLRWLILTAAILSLIPCFMAYKLGNVFARRANAGKRAEPSVAPEKIGSRATSAGPLE